MASDALAAQAAALASSGMQVAGDALSSRKANKRMIEFWRMQNEYNDPKQQMQRLQNAGLNPNLIYGDSVSGATGRADSIGKPERMTNFTSPVTEYQNIRQADAQLNLSVAQNNTEFQRAILLAEQQANTNAGTNKKVQDYNIAADMFPGQLQLQELATKNLQEEILGRSLENDFKDKSMQDRVKDLYWRAKNTEANLEGRQKNNSLLELQRQFLNLGLDRNSPWYAKIFGNIVNKTVNKEK